jgi:hypothetical protein
MADNQAHMEDITFKTNIGKSITNSTLQDVYLKPTTTQEAEAIPVADNNNITSKHSCSTTLNSTQSPTTYTFICTSREREAREHEAGEPNCTIKYKS